jgi:DNA-nicking Smr family endonuclease
MARRGDWNNRPLADLAQRVGPLHERADEDRPAESAPAEQEAAPPPSDEELFAREMADVRPLAGEAYVPPARPGRERIVVRDEVAEVMAELDDLVAGRTVFDLTFSAEHIEGLAEGVDRKLLRRLRKGDYAVRAHLDLHGTTRREAKHLVDRFFEKQRALGHRCLLIVHGRGLHSRDGIPVLKESLRSWLLHGRIARFVLAFCSARPVDGGMGAVYVLLRR